MPFRYDCTQWSEELTRQGRQGEHPNQRFESCARFGFADQLRRSPPQKRDRAHRKWLAGGDAPQFWSEAAFLLCVLGVHSVRFQGSFNTV